MIRLRGGQLRVRWGGPEHPHLPAANQPRILPNPDNSACGRIVVDRCRQAGFEPDTRYLVTDYVLGLRLAATDLGIAVTSLLVAPTPPAGLRYREFDTPLVRTITALTKPAPVRPAVGAFVTSLRAVAAE